MAALHTMNPLRTGWVADRIPPACRLLDVGCGGGIAAEAFAQKGFAVTGIDAAEAPIRVARAHAKAGGLKIDYRATTAEALRDAGQTFDAVCALEVIEHTADPAGFIRLLASLVAPGGRLFVSTISRTWRAYAFAIVGAERVLKLLPVGTHDWNRFVTPDELAGFCPRSRAVVERDHRNGADPAERQVAGEPGYGGELSGDDDEVANATGRAKRGPRHGGAGRFVSGRCR